MRWSADAIGAGLVDYIGTMWLEWKVTLLQQRRCIMSYSNSMQLSRRWPILLAVFASGLLMALANAPVQSKASPPSNDNQRNKAWTEYMEACVKLAAADLAVAESQNRQFKASVSEYDLQRLRLHRDFVQKEMSLVRQGGDYGDVIARYADLSAKLAELDVKSAEEARRKNPGSISDEQYERIRRNADVCRLQVALARDPAGALSIIDHLHWETHRLTAEVMRLNRRVDRLEEITPH